MLLLHGIHADRRAMLGRARFLHYFGYSVLLIDLHAHGESAGEAITFGVAEADDARAALCYLRERLPQEPVALLGASLGGAALLLQLANPAVGRGVAAGGAFRAPPSARVDRPRASRRGRAPAPVAARALFSCIHSSPR